MLSNQKILTPAEDTQLTKQYNGFADTFSEALTHTDDRNTDSNLDFFSYFDLSLEGKFVLDLGCGTGHDLVELKKRGAIIYGIDAAEKMVEIAKLFNPGANIQVARFDHTLPFESNYFDFVISKWALQNAFNIDPIYEEVARVLKVNGQLIYLAGHPICQFAQKKGKEKDYFEHDVVETAFWEGKVTIKEPTHTMNHYLTPTFFSKFSLFAYREGYDRSGGKINGDILPNYFIIKAVCK